MADKKWREYNIYDGKNEEDDEDDYASGLQLFGGIEDEAEEMMDFSIVGKTNVDSESEETIKVTLKGFKDYNHSTGMAVWLGSEVMANFLVQNPDLVRNKTVLEMGAGLGLAGIVSYQLDASKVVLTDGDTSVLNDYLRFNATHNSKSSTDIPCPQLIWGNQGHEPDAEENPLVQFRKEYGTFDVMIACDCTYMPQSLEPFWQTIDALLKRNENTNDSHHQPTLLYVMEASTPFPLEDVFALAKATGFDWTKKIVSMVPPTDSDSPADQEENELRDYEVFLFHRCS